MSNLNCVLTVLNSCNFLFALRTWVFRISHPLVNALKTINMSAWIQRCLLVSSHIVETNGAGMTFLFLRHFLQWFPWISHFLSHILLACFTACDWAAGLWKFWHWRKFLIFSIIKFHFFFASCVTSYFNFWRVVWRTVLKFSHLQ